MKTIIVLAAAIVAVMLLALGQSPAGATHMPLDEVAIDVDVTGNTAASLGTTEYCNAEPLEVGETIDIDVVVRGVPEYVDTGSRGTDSEGIWGYGFELLFDPEVLYIEKVQALEGPSLIWSEEGSVPFFVVDYGDGRIDEWSPAAPVAIPTPRYKPGPGHIRVDAVDLGGPYEHGDGVLTRITVEAVGQGVSELLFADYSTGAGNTGPAVFDAQDGQALYDFEHVGYGALVVAEGTCPDTIAPPPPPVRNAFTFTAGLSTGLAVAGEPTTLEIALTAEVSEIATLDVWLDFNNDDLEFISCESTFAPCEQDLPRRVLFSTTDVTLTEVETATITVRPLREGAIYISLGGWADALGDDSLVGNFYEFTHFVAIGLETPTSEPTPTPTFPPRTPTRTPPSATCACIPVPTATVTPSPTASTTAAATPAVTPAALPRAGDAMDSPKNGGVVLIVVSAALIVAGAWVVARRRRYCVD